MKYYIYANKLENGNVEIGASNIAETVRVPLEEVDEALANYSLIEFGMNKLAGKILTLVDATMSEPRQNKAFKDVIRNYFAEEFSFFSELMMKGSIRESLKEVEEMNDEEFAEWEKKNPPVDISEIICPDNK